MTNKQLLEAISSLKIEIREEMKSIQTSCKDLCYKLEENMEQMKKKIEEHENILQQQDSEKRRRNIIIHGIEEEETNRKQLEENIIKIIQNILKVQITLPEIDIMYRLGPKRTEKTRPVIVKFTTQRKVLELLSNRKNLKNTRIYINEDMTKEKAEERKKLVAEMKKYREAGKHAIIKNGKLIIEGKEGKKEDEGKKTESEMENNKKRQLSEEDTENTQISTREVKKKFEEGARKKAIKDTKISDYVYRTRFNSIGSTSAEQPELTQVEMLKPLFSTPKK